MMTVLLAALCAHFGMPLLTLFANTGEEDEETLRFVDWCDRYFNLNVVWLEAVVDPRPGKGTRHRVVTYETASRRGEPFEQVIAKYGIPNRNYPHCTRETKLKPIESYMKALGWPRDSYAMAVGIRADEVDRMQPDAHKNGIIYPLATMGVRRPDTFAFFKALPFDLYLAEHKGNCKGCYKKSDRKLWTLAVDDPTSFDFSRRMEMLYDTAGAGVGPRRFYRGGKSVDELIADAMLTPFEKFVDGNQVFDPALDSAEGCEDSCEIDFAAMA